MPRPGARQIIHRSISVDEEKAYHWIAWNVCGADDAATRQDAAQITRNVTEGAAGRDVCIVLLHDPAATAATVRALPDILAWFEAEGYRFCTVEEMFSMTDGGG